MACIFVMHQSSALSSSLSSLFVLFTPHPKEEDKLQLEQAQEGFYCSSSGSDELSEERGRFRAIDVRDIKSSISSCTNSRWFHFLATQVASSSFFIVHFTVDFESIHLCNTNSPDKDCPPPLPILQPMIWPVQIPQLVGNISAVHVLVVFINWIQPHVAHHLCCPSRRQPHLPLLVHPLHLSHCSRH